MGRDEHGAAAASDSVAIHHHHARWARGRVGWDENNIGEASEVWT